MIRIAYIDDAQLRRRVLDKLAEWRGTTAAQIPEWFELDDADYSELLIELRCDENGEHDNRREYD